MPTPRSSRRVARGRVVLTGVVAGLATLAGCSFSYNEPPMSTPTEPKFSVAPGLGTMVIVGPFRNPSHAPVAWRDIGPGMSEALVGALRKQGLDARVDASLAGRVAEATRASTEKRGKEFERLHRDHREVELVVIGHVTDFAHSADLPTELQRWGVFGRKSEAVVAIRLEVIDLDRGRLVTSDHIYATADAPKTESSELYGGVSFGSYIFWNTPLGQASERVLENAITLVTAAIPEDAGPIHIAQQVGARRVRLAESIESKTHGHRTYRVCFVNRDTGRRRMVIDPDTKLPLLARLDTSRPVTKTAWLIGRTPPDLDLSGAILWPIPEDAMRAASATP